MKKIPTVSKKKGGGRRRWGRTEGSKSKEWKGEDKFSEQGQKVTAV